jgi:membrane protein YqaA with SNARE-associated domain
MLINGVVSYGTSLTINGQYMPVADGNITFTYYTYETETIPSTDPNVPPITNTITVNNEGNMPVKGMAIDWEDGHVYLVFTEQGKTRYDLGEYNTTAANVVIAGTDTGKDTVAADIISGTGTWYWQSNLYTIQHATETVLHLDLTQGLSGWGMTLQVSMLLFVGMLMAGGDVVLTVTVAAVGNWLGGLTGYWLGWLGKLEWLERWFRVKSETIEKHRTKVEKWGPLLALMTWLPFVGDVFAIVLGFYKAKFVPSAIWMFVGKCGRFVVWALIVGAFTA